LKTRIQQFVILWLKRLTMLSVFAVLLFRWLPVYNTPYISTEVLFSGQHRMVDKDWVSLRNINPIVVKAVVASEDQLFFEHWGFDFESMWKAYNKNRKGKKIRGGSTITQQTAKNVFLWHGRSYVRKLLEAYFTVLIEVFWSKERVIEVYLNVAEFGDHVFGVEAAAKHYFNTDARSLTKEQASTLAALLPNPKLYSTRMQGKYMQKRKKEILRQMRYMK
jgi:monofunctional glycosyltransferase